MSNTFTAKRGDLSFNRYYGSVSLQEDGNTITIEPGHNGKGVLLDAVLGYIKGYEYCGKVGAADARDVLRRIVEAATEAHASIDEAFPVEEAATAS